VKILGEMYLLLALGKAGAEGFEEAEEYRRIDAVAQGSGTHTPVQQLFQLARQAPLSADQFTSVLTRL
jgi:hypothetical protein